MGIVKPVLIRFIRLLLDLAKGRHLGVFLLIGGVKAGSTTADQREVAYPVKEHTSDHSHAQGAEVESLVDHIYGYQPACSALSIPLVAIPSTPISLLLVFSSIAISLLLRRRRGQMPIWVISVITLRSTVETVQVVIEGVHLCLINDISKARMNNEGRGVKGRWIGQALNQTLSVNKEPSKGPPQTIVAVLCCVCILGNEATHLFMPQSTLLHQAPS